MRPIEISIFLWLCSFHLAYSKIKDPGKKKLIQKVSGEANYWKAQESVYEDDATTTDVDFTTQKPIRHTMIPKNHTKEKTSTAKLPAKKKTEIGTERERKARKEDNEIEGPEPPPSTSKPKVTKKNTNKPTKETAKSTLPPGKNPQSPGLPSGFVQVQKTVKSSNSKKKSIILSRKLKKPSPPGFGLKKDKRKKGAEVLPTPGMLPPQRKISNDNDLEDDPDDDHSREVEEPRSSRKNSVKSSFVPLSTAKKVGDVFVTTPKMPTKTQKPKSSKIRVKHTPKTTTTTQPTSTTTANSSNENEEGENEVQGETTGTTGTDEFVVSSNTAASSFEPVDTTGTIILMSSKDDFEDEATTITTRSPTTLPQILSSITTSFGKRQCKIEVK
ncbi:hypothetical protein WR25_03862 [Diploscapter pachys]|uniref:Uncharacterized protein n=1 Tax=Diploscapter pachys TaxID=2018661 RepID=A0A2A2JMM8_9BILA|nr:hypothetical protein WR25_03862 [Diploscapter pachys]